MPNHCENDLWMRGEDADVQAVLLHIGACRPEPAFDFNTLIPYPDRYRQMDDDHEAIPDLVGVYRDDPERPAKVAARNEAMAAYQAKWGTTSNGFNSGGYEWCCTEWGTKWGAYDVARRDYDGRVCLTFQTAWAPAMPVLQALAEKFPRVTFVLEYFERGREFSGGCRWASEEDYYDEGTPWHPGIKTDEWLAKGYRGMRGG